MHTRLIKNQNQDSEPGSTGNHTSRMNIFLDFVKKARNKTLVGTLSSFVFIPTLAYAGVFSFLGGLSFAHAESKNYTVLNSQNIGLLEVKLDEQKVVNLQSFGGPRVAIASDGALIPEFSPYSFDYEIAEVTSTSGQIVIYQVQHGDTISEIAERYSISTNTIKWANGIKKGGSIREGQDLVLLPITGIQVEIKSGDTISTIASKYSADAEEIANYNGFDIDEKLAVGEKIIIPDGELGAESTVIKEIKITKKTKNPTSQVKETASSDVVAKRKELEAYFIRPVDGVVSQGKHGPFEGFDIANKTGTPIYAMADGVAVISKSTGWNGGYGQYIVIRHGNKTQTLYGHLSKNDIVAGQKVTQGQKIGELGSTGRSTGPHLHYEVRGDPDRVPTPILY